MGHVKPALSDNNSLDSHSLLLLQMSISGLTFPAEVSKPRNAGIFRAKIISVDIIVFGSTELKDDHALDSTGQTVSKQNCPKCFTCLFPGAGWNRSAFSQTVNCVQNRFIFP